MLRKLLGPRLHKVCMDGLWKNHPVLTTTLGICSSLAVTSRVSNAIAMGCGVTFVLIATGFLISPLRKMIPARARIITYMLSIAAFTIIVDKILQAFFPEISEAMGPYVGLIITNCILMGRAEAFYIQNDLAASTVDAVANGLSYTGILIVIAVIRELLAFGELLGHRVLPAVWENWVIMSMPAGAFFLLGAAVWISKTLQERKS